MMKLLASSGIALLVVLLSTNSTQFQLYWSVILIKFVSLTAFIWLFLIKNVHLFLGKLVEKFSIYPYKKLIVASIASLIITLLTNGLWYFHLNLINTLIEFIGLMIFIRFMLIFKFGYNFIYIVTCLFLLMQFLHQCHKEFCILFAVILFIVAPLLIIKIYETWQKIINIKKLIFRIENAPIFSTDLIDCYINFTGVIVSPNQFISPQYKKPCAYYDSKIFAHWQAKAKKPAKGLQDQIKAIYQQQAENSLLQLISTCGETVFIEMNDFVKFTPIKTGDKFTICPSLCTDKAEERYQYYSRQEKYYTHGEELFIYGKLIRTNTGEFYLKPTGLQYYVSMLLNNQEFALSFEEILNDWKETLFKEDKLLPVFLVVFAVLLLITRYLFF